MQNHLLQKEVTVRDVEGGGFGESHSIALSSQGLSNDSQPCQKPNISSPVRLKVSVFFDSAARIMLQNLILLPLSLLLSSDQPLPTALLQPERFQDHESASDLLWPRGQCSGFCLHVRYGFSLPAVLCCNARWAEQMGRLGGGAQG